MYFEVIIRELRIAEILKSINSQNTMLHSLKYKDLCIYIVSPFINNFIV
jgi:hypothetical protein